MPAFEGQQKLGRIVRDAAKAAEYDVRDADLERLNSILVGEAFVSALTDAGCMITRIPNPNMSAVACDCDSRGALADDQPGLAEAWSRAVGSGRYVHHGCEEQP